MTFVVALAFRFTVIGRFICRETVPAPVEVTLQTLLVSGVTCRPYPCRPRPRRCEPVRQTSVRRREVPVPPGRPEAGAARCST